MGQMAAQLMGSSGSRTELQQAQAGMGITPHGIREFGGGQAGVFGLGRLHLIGVEFGPERIVNQALRIGPTAHDGVVALLHLSGGKELAHPGTMVDVQRKEQYPTGGTVQSMTGIDGSAELVTEHLHGKFTSLSIQRGPVHQQTTGLVDRNKPFVLIKYFQWWWQLRRGGKKVDTFMNDRPFPELNKGGLSVELKDEGKRLAGLGLGASASGHVTGRPWWRARWREDGTLKTAGGLPAN